MQQRIGILGGTFDPPHIAHLILAEYTIEALELDFVLFVPAGDPPHKRDQTRTTIKHRLAMLDCAILGNERFTISLVDVERPGPHYSVDMVRIVQQQYPDADLYFLMGGDNLRELPRWHQPEELIRQCKLAVLRRSDEDIYAEMHKDVLPGLAERVVMVNTPLMGVWISSTHIVQRLREGRSARYLVPQSVLDYIAANHIYSNENE